MKLNVPQSREVTRKHEEILVKLSALVSSWQKNLKERCLVNYFLSIGFAFPFSICHHQFDISDT